jgi:GntR family transcriptional regulator, arabinose operon transcriptional repressor
MSGKYCIQAESGDSYMRQPAKYIIVKDKIKEWVVDGHVQPGEKIYSENELVKMFGVSRHTIRQAVGDLVHEGWLYREQGAGTFVSSHKPNLKPAPTDQVAETGGGKSIGVITTYISDYIFPSIIKGIESYLTSKGYSLVFACTDNDIEKEKQCLDTMLSRNIEGLIVEPTKSSAFNPNINYYLQMEQQNIPYLMINQYYSQLNPPHIMLNDEKGGFIATDHLIRHGHERIIGLFKTDDLQGVYRMKGFVNAFREHNITFFPEMIISYSTEDKNSVLSDKLEGLFSSPETKPTGIVCYNDEMALGVVNMLREKGLSVPEDVSIVGYDDSYLAEASGVKLTSVSHPKTQMGIDAAKWIVTAVENKNGLEQKSIIYDPKLVIRNSTRSIVPETIGPSTLK